jgi:hypothetical protein
VFLNAVTRLKFQCPTAINTENLEQKNDILYVKTFDKFNETSYIIRHDTLPFRTQGCFHAYHHGTYLSHSHYASTHTKQTFFPSTTEGASNNTQHLEQSKGFLRHILVFIQFLSSFYNYYSTIWNNDQNTKISYLVSVKGRLLS